VPSYPSRPIPSSSFGTRKRSSPPHKFWAHPPEKEEREMFTGEKTERGNKKK
jgi:hypothetical protein